MAYTQCRCLMQGAYVILMPQEDDLVVFSSPGPKDHVSFCHNFASVVVVRL